MKMHGETNDDFYELVSAQFLRSGGRLLPSFLTLHARFKDNVVK